MLYAELTGYLVGHIPVGNEVQVIRFYMAHLLAFPTALQAVQRGATDAAASAVLENKNRFFFGFFLQLTQVINCAKRIPFHIR